MAKPRYLPYGYRIQNGIITPDTAQAEYVRQIYQLYLAGNSLQEIENACNSSASHTAMRQAGTRTPFTAS